MSVNRGFQKRPDGGYSVLFGASAATADDLGQRYMQGTRCTSLVIKDDVIYHALKFSVDSFEDCPVAPDPAAFEEDGAALDLDALGADSAGVLRRPEGRDRWARPTSSSTRALNARFLR